jgi:hypothetical protein
MALLIFNISSQAQRIHPKSAINNHRMPHCPNLVRSILVDQCPDETHGDKYHLHNMNLGKRKVGGPKMIEGTLDRTAMGSGIIIPIRQYRSRDEKSKIRQHRCYADVSPSRVVVQIVIQDGSEARCVTALNHPRSETTQKCLELIEQCLLNPTMRIIRPVTSC